MIEINYDGQELAKGGGLAKINAASKWETNNPWVLCFTERDRRAAYRDIHNQTDAELDNTYDSVKRLRKLTHDGSHQARVLLGYVQCGEIPIINSVNKLDNDELFMHQHVKACIMPDVQNIERSYDIEAVISGEYSSTAQSALSLD